MELHSGYGILNSGDRFDLYDDYFICNGTKHLLSDVKSVEYSDRTITGPYIDLYLYSLEHKFFHSIRVIFSKKEYDKFQTALNYLLEHYGGKSEDDEKEKRFIQHLEEINCVYYVEGVRGRILYVFEDRCVIETSVTLGSLISGNANDGKKTIYYSDCIGVQFKLPGIQIGYLQLETASMQMNNQTNNFFNENTFTFDDSVVDRDYMIEIYEYIQKQVEQYKRNNQPSAINALSAADELKKFKELLDLEIISQEEFDAKKKQLLGL